MPVRNEAGLPIQWSVEETQALPKSIRTALKFYASWSVLLPQEGIYARVRFYEPFRPGVVTEFNLLVAVEDFPQWRDWADIPVLPDEVK